MSLLKTLVVISICVVITSCHHEIKNDQDLSIKIGRKDSLQSDILGETRPYWVYVPPYTQESGEKFTVLYLLDGDAHFHSVSGLSQILGTGINGTRLFPEMMVVAIPNIDRTKDLTPTHSEILDGEKQEFLKTSGGGVNFLKFLKEELIPHIDSRYPTSPYRILVGHSFGGITAINALYMIPEAFDSYISIDPSLWWDDHLLLKLAPEILADEKLDGKYLFLSQANTLKPGESTNDHFGSIKEYEKVLKTTDTGLKWAFKYYPEDSHGSVPLISTYDGLRFIFGDYQPTYEKIGRDPAAFRKNYEKYKSPPPERLTNSFGYRAMAEGKADLARIYFQMNIDFYPKSSDAFDSMADYWKTKGDTAKAIENYKKSVDVNPQNDKARRMLDTLQSKR
jgi:uncharacterized protein